MDTDTREHLRHEARSYELMVQRAENELSAMEQRGDTEGWKTESLRECLDDAREIAAGMRRLMSES